MGKINLYLDLTFSIMILSTPIHKNSQSTKDIKFYNLKQNLVIETKIFLACCSSFENVIRYSNTRV